MKLSRGYQALRRFRATPPHTSYFITLCTQARKQGLNRTESASAIQAEISAIENAGHWTLRAATIMPDHVHLLLTLHDTLSLGQTIARLKSKTRSTLRNLGLGWQGNYYEHRVRPNESVECVIRYIHLNPYRVGLLDAATVYPWFWLGSTESAWFRPLTDDGKPFPEWLC